MEVFMDIKITFPGGKKVNAEIGGMVITTDQPKEYGGSGTAPSPFIHFLASIGTCAGIYVLSFCNERKIPTEGLSIDERVQYVTTADGMSKLDKIILDIQVPPGFPEKYLNAIMKVADQCAVKKTIMNPPAFEVKVTSK
jgi:ribosomal protein S12 methylthiotransferase accessory factor